MAWTFSNCMVRMLWQQTGRRSLSVLGATAAAGILLALLGSALLPRASSREVGLMLEQQQTSILLTVNGALSVWWVLVHREVVDNPLLARLNAGSARSVALESLGLWLVLLTTDAVLATAFAILHVSGDADFGTSIGSTILSAAFLAACAPAVVRLPLNLAGTTGLLLAILAGQFGFFGDSVPWLTDTVSNRRQMAPWTADALACAGALLLSLGTAHLRRI